MPRRPSFVLFITDQQRADFLGCFGHPVLRTPNIDALAADGVCFDRFYVGSPVCMPNRATLMTGRMPSAHRVRSNGIPLAAGASTFVELLRDAGYFTALVGKSHLQNFTGKAPIYRPPAAPEGFHVAAEALREAWKPDADPRFYAQESPAFWRNADARVETPFYGFGHVDLCTGHGDEVGGDYARWLREHAPELAQRRGAGHGLAHDYACPQAWRTPVPPELYPSTYVAERAENLILERLALHREQPFFLMVSFPDPHHPFTPPGRYWDLYSPDDMPAPAAYAARDWTPPPHVRWAIEAREQGKANLQGMSAFAVGEREAREAQALTCGMIALIDDCIGRVLTALRDTGLYEDSVFLFTSDHGDFLGDHRLLLKGPAHYQSLVRVPFIWRDPALTGGAARTAALAGTVDIAASILERARVAPYNGMQGRSFLPILAGQSESRWPALLVEEEQQRVCMGFEAPPRVRSLITPRWRLSIYDGVEWGELYDLEVDPGELRNLWDDPAARSVRASLIEQLARKQLELTDRSPAPSAMA